MQSLHTHTKYCDGFDTPEELVKEAISRGFDGIGFSGHSYMHREPKEYSMTPSNNRSYRRVIQGLKEKYAGQIHIFCGMEADYYTDADMTGYDYLIGSAHYILKDGELLDFDRTDIKYPQYIFKGILDQHFGGNGMKMVKAYYETLAQLGNGWTRETENGIVTGKYDFIGHFDLILKHNESMRFVDEESKEYQNLAIEAAEALAGKIKLFEVNTGAMSRGFRSKPYPAPFLLKELKRLGFGAVITSDCHRKENMGYYFEEAEELLRDSGFREKYILTEDGFAAKEL